MVRSCLSFGFFNRKDSSSSERGHYTVLYYTTLYYTVLVGTYYNIAITGRAKTVDGFLMAAFESSGNQNRTNIIILDTYIPRTPAAAAVISVRSDCIICIDANM